MKYVHESSFVDDGAQIGNGTKIWHFSHVCADAKIGRDVSIGQNVYIANNVIIGDRCKIQNNVSIYDNITIQDEVFVGPSVVFTNVYNPRAAINRKHEYLDTIIEKGVSLGANSTVICGHTLGRYAFIGAGALVNKNVKPYALVVGVPARQIGWMSKHGTRLQLPLTHSSQLECVDAGQRYILSDGVIQQVEDEK